MDPRSDVDQTCGAVWTKLSLAGCTEDSGTSSVALHENVLYVGCASGGLIGVNASDGALLYQNTPPDSQPYMSSSPVVTSSGMVLIASGNFLYGWSPDTGNPGYFERGMQPADLGMAVAGSPSLHPNGSVAYIGGASGNGGMMAVDMKGKLLWTFTTGSPVSSSAVVDANNTLYFGSETGVIYALSAEGHLRWQYTAGGCVVATPALGPQLTLNVAGCNGTLFQLNRTTGALVWTTYPTNPFTTQTNVQSSPAVDRSGTIFWGAPGADAGLFAYTFTGQYNFTFLPSLSSNIYSSPAIGADSTVVFVAEDVLYVVY